MALKLKEPINGYADAWKLLQNMGTHPEDAIRVAVTWHKSDGDVYAYALTEGEAPYEWRVDGLRWSNLRTTHFPKKGNEKFITKQEFQLIGPDGPKDLQKFYRYEYFCFGLLHGTAAPISLDKWKYPYIIITYKGMDFLQDQSVAPHGRLMSMSQRSSVVNELTSTSSPGKTPSKDNVAGPSGSSGIGQAGSKSPKMSTAVRKLFNFKKKIISTAETSPSNLSKDETPGPHVPEMHQPLEFDEPETSRRNIDAELPIIGTPKRPYMKPFVRSSPNLLARMRDSLRTGTHASTVYTEQLLTGTGSAANSSVTCPRNMKQVYNAAHLARGEAHDDLFRVYEFITLVPDFVDIFDLAKGLTIACSHPLVIDHVNELLKHCELLICMYDTTYNKGNIYLSTLSIRHPLFLGNRIVPIAFLMHEFTGNEYHSKFFYELVRLIPGLNSSICVVVTDREQSITIAIRENLPLTQHMYCWNHMRENFKRFVEKKVTQEQMRVLKEQLFNLLDAISIEAYNELKLELSTAWSDEVMAYYENNLERDVKANARFLLEPRGLYNSTSGITTNSAESMNNMLRVALSETDFDFGRTIYVLYFFQTRFSIDIARGLEGTGEFEQIQDKETQEVLKKLRGKSMTDNADDNVDLKVIKDIVYNGKYPDEVKTVTLPNLRAVQTEEGLAKFFVARDRVDLVKGRGRFVVKGLSNKYYLVHLGTNICSCNGRNLCSHKIAAQITAGTFKSGAKVNARAGKPNLGKLYRRTASKKTGRKGKSLKAPAGAKRSEQPTDPNSVDVAIGASLESEEYHEVDEPESSDTNQGTSRRTRCPFRILRTWKLDDMPELKNSNARTTCIFNLDWEVKLMHLYTLKTELTENELTLMTASSSDVVEAAVIHENVVDEFFRSMCTASDVLSIPSKTVKKHLSVDPSFDAELLELDTLYTRKGLKMVFLPYQQDINQWLLVVLKIKERKIVVLDPAQAFSLDEAVQSKLISRFALKSGDWVCENPIDVYPLADPSDLSKSAASICYYLQVVIGGKKFGWNVNWADFRGHMLSKIAQNCDIFTVVNETDNNCGVCGKPDPVDEPGNKKTVWIRCDRCSAWTHMKCSGVDPTRSATSEFVCRVQRK